MIIKHSDLNKDQESSLTLCAEEAHEYLTDNSMYNWNLEIGNETCRLYTPYDNPTIEIFVGMLVDESVVFIYNDERYDSIEILATQNDLVTWLH